MFPRGRLADARARLRRSSILQHCCCTKVFRRTDLADVPQPRISDPFLVGLVTLVFHDQLSIQQQSRPVLAQRQWQLTSLSTNLHYY